LASFSRVSNATSGERKGKNLRNKGTKIERQKKIGRFHVIQIRSAMAIDTQSDYAALACSVRGVKLSGALQSSELLQATKIIHSTPSRILNTSPWQVNYIN
jgi:hypothetical protein